MRKSEKNSVAIFLAAALLSGIFAVSSPSIIDTEATEDKRDDYKQKDRYDDKNNRDDDKKDRHDDKRDYGYEDKKDYSYDSMKNRHDDKKDYGYEDKDKRYDDKKDYSYDSMKNRHDDKKDYGYEDKDKRYDDKKDYGYEDKDKRYDNKKDYSYDSMKNRHDDKKDYGYEDKDKRYDDKKDYGYEDKDKRYDDKKDYGYDKDNRYGFDKEKDYSYDKMSYRHDDKRDYGYNDDYKSKDPNVKHIKCENWNINGHQVERSIADIDQSLAEADLGSLAVTQEENSVEALSANPFVMGSERNHDGFKKFIDKDIVVICNFDGKDGKDKKSCFDCIKLIPRDLLEDLNRFLDDRTNGKIENVWDACKLIEKFADKGEPLKASLIERILEQAWDGILPPNPDVEDVIEDVIECLLERHLIVDDIRPVM